MYFSPLFVVLLVAEFATYVTGRDIVDVLSENETLNLWESTVAIDSAFYNKYVPDGHFELTVNAYLSSASVNLVKVTCPEEDKGVLCALLSEHHLSLVRSACPDLVYDILCCTVVQGMWCTPVVCLLVRLTHHYLLLSI
jgi:hypothetical protein